MFARVFYKILKDLICLEFDFSPNQRKRLINVMTREISLEGLNCFIGPLTTETVMAGHSKLFD